MSSSTEESGSLIGRMLFASLAIAAATMFLGKITKDRSMTYAPPKIESSAVPVEVGLKVSPQSNSSPSAPPEPAKKKTA
jgi:hypothetical protein